MEFRVVGPSGPPRNWLRGWLATLAILLLVPVLVFPIRTAEASTYRDRRVAAHRDRPPPVPERRLHEQRLNRHRGGLLVLRFAHIDGLTVTGNVQPLSSGVLASIVDRTGVTYR